LVIGLIAALLAVAGGAWALRTWVLGRAIASPQPPEVANLAAAVIDTQVELARRKLDTGDYAGAARQAERALKLDPTHEGARSVMAEASVALGRVEAAAAALRQAAARGGEASVGAAFELMKVDPSHPEAVKAAKAAGAGFRPLAEEARRLATAARAAADRAGGSRLPAFADGAALEKQGQQALQAGQNAAAAQRFLEARIRFERASR
jgi:tetratricopeptide (TPR) repeat protein